MKHKVTITIETEEAFSNECTMNMEFDPSVVEHKDSDTPTTVEFLAVTIIRAIQGE